MGCRSEIEFVEGRLHQRSWRDRSHLNDDQSTNVMHRNSANYVLFSTKGIRTFRCYGITADIMPKLDDRMRITSDFMMDLQRASWLSLLTYLRARKRKGEEIEGLCAYTLI